MQRPRGRDADQIIRQLALKQHRLVTSAQLREAGLSEGAIEHRLDARRLLPVFRGVFLVGVGWLDRDTLLRAALLHGGDHAAAAGESGMALRGVLPPQPSFVTVATMRELPERVATELPMLGSNRPGTARFLRSTRLERAEVIDGVRTTELPRTFVDLAVHSPAVLEQAWHEADFRGLLSLDDFERALRSRRKATQLFVH